MQSSQLFKYQKMWFRHKYPYSVRCDSTFRNVCLSVLRPLLFERNPLCSSTRCSPMNRNFTSQLVRTPEYNLPTHDKRDIPLQLGHIALENNVSTGVHGYIGLEHNATTAVHSYVALEHNATTGVHGYIELDNKTHLLVYLVTLHQMEKHIYWYTL